MMSSMSDSCYSPHVYGTVCLLADEQAVSQSVFVSPYFKHKLFLGTIKQQTARVLYIYICGCFIYVHAYYLYRLWRPVWVIIYCGSGSLKNPYIPLDVIATICCHHVSLSCWKSSPLGIENMKWRKKATGTNFTSCFRYRSYLWMRWLHV